jgi:GNAT superfamily N-acetyltransferase
MTLPESMSADAIQIKQFELSEQEALLSFLRTAYLDEPRKYDPGYWKWHYLENPCTTPDNIPVWIVKDQDRIVGQAATILVELKVADETRHAVWILEFILLPEYRGKKLGKRLLLLAREQYPTMFALGYNELSGNVLRSLDWVTMSTIHRYQRLLYPGHAVPEVAAIPPLRGLINAAYAPLRPKVPRKSGQLTIRKVVNFDQSFDDLWQRAATQWPCAVVRSAKFLEWQFKKQPGKQFVTLGAYAADRLAGYVVLFFRKAGAGGAVSKVAITDICYEPTNADTVINELIQSALNRAVQERAGSLVTDILDPRIESHLARLGFWPIKAAPPFMVYSPTQQPLMYDPANWFLTRADSDVSIFEAPNI